MKARAFAALATMLAVWSAQARAAIDTAIVVPAAPSIAVTGAATTMVPNDRMQSVLRVETEHAIPSTAANEANARMDKALAKVKQVPGVEAKSAGYSTWQTYEKGRPARWKVVQSLMLTGSDFAAIAALMGRLQDEDGLLVSNISFTVAPATRRKAEDALMREAIRSWQQRATTAAEALGYSGWRAGRLSVQTGDVASIPRPEVMMRAQAAGPAGGAPVPVEGGTTELTVTVTGEALLDTTRSR